MAVRLGSQCFRYPRRLPQRRLRPQWLSLTCPTLADDALVALGKVDVLFHLDDLPEPAMRQHLVTGGQYPGLEVLEPEPERRSRLYLLIILDAGIAWSAVRDADGTLRDRKSTRLNSSH